MEKSEQGERGRNHRRRGALNFSPFSWPTRSVCCSLITFILLQVSELALKTNSFYFHSGPQQFLLQVLCCAAPCWPASVRLVGTHEYL